MRVAIGVPGQPVRIVLEMAQHLYAGGEAFLQLGPGEVGVETDVRGSLVITAAGGVAAAPIDPEAALTALRVERTARLARTVDAISGVRWAAMGEDERAAWSAYRQALLDLPATTPDPANPAWPTPPA